MQSVVAPVVTLNAGSYDLTFTADPVCTQLPDDVRTRTYAAAVEAGSNDFAGAYRVVVPGLLFLQDTFLIGVSGSYLATQDGGAPTLYENVAQDRYLGIDFLIGTTDVRTGNGSVEIPLPGMFEYCSVLPGTTPRFCDFFPSARVVAYERCNAPNHRMLLTRK